MEQCKSCNTSIFPEALFCHNCGRQTERVKIICSECKNVNPKDARFCFRCGSPIDISYSPKPYISPIFGLDFSNIQTIPRQISESFERSLSIALEYENNTEKEALFLAIYHESDFKTTQLEEACILLTQEFEELYDERGKSAFNVIEKRLDQQFAQLFECFAIEYCNHLLAQPLPKSILAFKDNNIRSHNLGLMIRTYLEIPLDKQHFFQAVEIPLAVLKNTRKTFFYNSDKPPLFFCDLSILQNGKEGLILNSDSIYWKCCFHKSAFMKYTEINNIHYYSDHLKINGIYLNVDAAFNYRLYRLLIRLKTMSYL